MYIFFNIATLLIINCVNKCVYFSLHILSSLLQLTKNQVILIIFKIFALSANYIINKSNI